MPGRIEDYALIGDCETAALVDRNGSIDWLCWPRFDSGACFARLLGTDENGSWRIEAQEPIGRTRRRYRPRTLILETDIETADGAFTLIDFMPPRGEASDLVRLVVGKAGRVKIRSLLRIRFDYGAITPWVSRIEQGITAIAGPDMAVLRSPAPLREEEQRIVSEFTLSPGETMPFVLTYSPAYGPVPPSGDPETLLAETDAFWQEWSAHCNYEGPWADAVLRSHITMKALTYGPTGGIVAAPTTSLPEQIGGIRNWDYRFCWLRDAALTLLSLMEAGFVDEARAWRDWLLRAAAGNPSQMQIMYGIAGEHRLPEFELPWLQGYEASRPVRIGNAAHRQFQLDIFGELTDALHVARHTGIPPSEAGWMLEKRLIEFLETVWQEPDEGIWEFRGPRQHFTYSKVMAWRAVDRTVLSAQEFGLHGPIQHWKELRQRIHDDVCAKAFDPSCNSFTQAYESKHLDASLLLIPMTGFLPPEDPRVKGTVAAVEKYLMVDGFVRRYDTDTRLDGLPPGEGAFLPCSFWLADNFILQGRHTEAENLFVRLLDLCNDVGLLAEEYDPAAGRMLGNFPQAFSHLALVHTARALTDRSPSWKPQR